MGRAVEPTLAFVAGALVAVPPDWLPVALVENESDGVPDAEKFKSAGAGPVPVALPYSGSEDDPYVDEFQSSSEPTLPVAPPAGVAVAFAMAAWLCTQNNSRA